jgi:uncharacterized membrane protein
MDQEISDVSNRSAIHHLARLSDCIFALAMAITFMGLQLPEILQPMSDSQVNHFLFEQLKSLGIYVITFVLITVYWVTHVQQYSYYKKANEVYLWLYALYLMCLLIVPFSNDLVFRLSSYGFAKIWFSVNIGLIGMLSFASWVYATTDHRLVDENLNPHIILSVKVKALIEPIFAFISIPVALIDPDWWDFVWLLILIVSPIVDQFLKMGAEVETQFTAQTIDAATSTVLHSDSQPLP